ncbi:Micrococcal nuclease (thermonuclease) homologs [Nocardioides sp. J9]|nr:Micrococcal nuclease (thermonuclease) homologs [Nocardioides sp. J9]
MSSMGRRVRRGVGALGAAALLALTGCELDSGTDAGQVVVTETVTETVVPTPEPTEVEELLDEPTDDIVEPAIEETTYVVTHVVDGDTIDLDNGERVRLVGIDTPERGECGFGPAQSTMKRLVLGKEVVLVESDEDRDVYDRLLRYVEVDGLDVGRQMLDKGLAIARYDSRDGYGRHPREDDYIAADEAAPDITCKRKPQQDNQPRGLLGSGKKDKGSSCEPGYDPCVPLYPPDLDCADVGPVTVTGPDPHGLDRDGDGRACGGD